MNFADALPATKTAFENFVFSNFNMSIDLSESNTFMVLALIGGIYVAWHKLYNVSKYSR